MERVKQYTMSVRLWPVTLLFGLMLLAPLAGVRAQSEFKEAMQETEDQWKAVRQTMQQSKEKLDAFKKIYQEYEDAVFSQNPEKGIELARRLFNLDKTQTAAAKEKLASLREMFNTLDKNGLKTKLQSVSEKLDLADKVAGEVENVWQFSKKFDPAHAKDNPTYGLRLIGTLLKDGAGKMEKIPLVGQILGKWIGAYGEIAGEFANALDKLGKKIEEMRGGSLCGQLGYKTDQQTAFEAASKTGEDCLTFFPVGVFPRMRGETYEGNNSYFLFDPGTKRGYFVSPGDAMKVYDWHERLLDRKALDPDWLASRANSLVAAVEQKARERYASFSGWADKSDPGWVIIDKLDLYQDAYKYGVLEEESFVANYVLAKTHRDAIETIMEKFEKHLLIGGTVYQSEDDVKKPSAGASVEFTVGGKTHSERTNSYGQYEILMEGKVNDAVHEKITKEGFESIDRDGRIAQNAILGQDYTLYKEAMTVVISGTVFIKEKKDEPAVVVSGATVSASASEADELGSATTGGDGSYSLTVKTIAGVEVTCAATKEDASGAASVTVTGGAHTGVDITITKASEEEAEEGTSWIINVLVLDAAGNPLPGATVSCTNDVAAVTTGGDGNATVGPIEIPETWPDEPFAVTVTPSVVVVGGARVGGSAAAVAFEGKTPSAVTLTIPVLIPQAVTISGRVTDANGIGVDGAVVTGGGQSATTTSGAFSVGPVMMHKDSSVALSAVLDDGTNSFAGGPVTCTFDGTNQTISITITLDMETETEVTISGSVKDLDSKPLAGAAVTGGGGATSTDGAGRYTLPAFTHKLGTPAIISASIVDKDGVTVGGQAEAVPTSDVASAPTIIIDVKQEDAFEVTISGTVVDANSAGVSGAAVTAGSVSTASGAAGDFSLLIDMVANETVAVSAVYTDGQDSYAGGPVSVTFDGTNTTTSVILVISKEKGTLVTISGTVTSTDGDGVSGATVSGGGQTTTTDAAGNFTLAPFEYEEGTPVAISASTFNADGEPVGGSASVTPTSEAVSVAIAIDMQSDLEDELDSLINEIENELDSLGIDYDGLIAEFNMLVIDLDGIAGDFRTQADYLAQRIRELGQGVCENNDAGYALDAAGSQLDFYDFTLSSLPGIYAELNLAQATDPTIDIGTVEAEFGRVIGQGEALEGQYAEVLGAYNAYECDEDAAETETGDIADENADPDDIESDAGGGGGVEVCGDGIDNDKDGEIDECDAGCCDKNVQVTVSDCGTAADDIFLISINGADVGVTPKGASNTFNIELSPGTYSVRVTCLDDGGDPLGSDIGTACVSVVVFGTNIGIGGGEMAIAYGGSATVSFTVPEGPAMTTVPQVFNGASLRNLE